tara:strand:- start:361 stop:1071 length:711 start_codon:yes stop_codon:yes gene_type:complete
MPNSELELGFPVDNWQPPPLPTEEPMEGAYCRLALLDPKAHVADLFDAFAKDAKGIDWSYLPYGPFNTPKLLEAWLEEIAELNDPLFYTIMDLQGKAVGVASYLRIMPTSGSIEVGHIHFSPELQKSRAATETMFIMMRHAFELGYRRYEWKCDSLNQRSRRAALRLGLSFEGIFRQATVYKGRNRDTAWYAAIDREWPQLEAMFEAWLDPENFDDVGLQRKSLSAMTASILVSTH